MLSFPAFARPSCAALMDWIQSPKRPVPPLEEMIAEGDKLAARFTMRGTHQGTFFGVPPTGKKIDVATMNFYHLSGGQFVEERGQPDLLGLLRQIGAIASDQGQDSPL